MTLYNDAEANVAIGWLTAVVGGQRLAEEYHRAKAQYPEMAHHFLRWADNQVASESMIDFRDRDRHRAADVATIYAVDGPNEDDIPF